MSPQEMAEHVFKQLIADYGKGAIKSKWETLSPNELKANIARRLGGYDIETIVWGLDMAVKQSPSFPPSIPDIVKQCDQKPKPQEYYQRLPTPNITHEEAERRIKQMEQAAEKIAAKRPGREWAEKIVKDPKSYPAYSVAMAKEALKEVE